MYNPKHRAFTLTELLFVVAIIGLLVSILSPFLSRAFTIQRRTQCTNNLHEIGVACSTRVGKLGLGVVGHVAPFGWQNSLSDFVSDDKSVFVCPEDDDPAPDLGSGLDGVCIECIHGGQFLWDVFLDQADSDKWIWKMSRTQYEEFMKVSGEGKTTGYKGIYEKTGYVEDDDPSTMYFTFEDTAPWGGGDQDFYDVVLEAHFTESTVEFNTMVRRSGMTFNVCVKNPDRKVLIANPRVGNTASIPYFGSKSSYGMNSMSSTISATKRKVLVLDYEYGVAVGSSLDEGVERTRHLGYWDPLPTDPKAPPSFARHFGKVNCLLADGGVKLLPTWEINPNDPENVDEYWDP